MSKKTINMYTLLFIVLVLHHSLALPSFQQHTFQYSYHSKNHVYSSPVNFPTIRNSTLVPDLSYCPPLPPRSHPPVSVHDLRVDDIKYFMALGDSITKAFAAKGHHSYNPIHHKKFYEYGGLSFAAGGDKHAVSLANFIKFYRGEDFVGPSIGKHLVRLCTGFFCPDPQYRTKDDHLNVARSGASVTNLEQELSYLLTELKSIGADQSQDFKFLNLFIGSNDICQRCTFNYASPEVFEERLRSVLEAVRLNIPNTVVNLMGVFNVSQVYDLTAGSDYCKWREVIPQLKIGCWCAFLPGPFGRISRRNMDDIAVEYDNVIKKVVNGYSSGEQDPSFAVVYQPFDLNMTTFPVEGLSNVDCFHPSVKSHQLAAKTLWNNLVVPPSLRERTIDWDDELGVRCFGADDRIQTSG